MPITITLEDNEINLIANLLKNASTPLLDTQAVEITAAARSLVEKMNTATQPKEGD